MPGPFVPFVAGAQIILAAASGGGPTRIDIETTCRTSENEITKIFGSTTVVTYDSCLRQENEALATIEKDWATYPTSDRATCVQPKGYMPSYVEWLTCFEMYRDVRKMRTEDAANKPATGRSNRRTR